MDAPGARTRRRGGACRASPPDGVILEVAGSGWLGYEYDRVMVEAALP
jgi:hypothetical protein